MIHECTTQLAANWHVHYRHIKDKKITYLPVTNISW